MDASRPRDVIVDSLGSLDDQQAERLRSGDPSLARAHLEALDENRTWVHMLGVAMAVMAIVLPTAGLYQFFRAVDNLEAIELVGVIAAACLVAAVQMGVAAYVYTDWKHRRFCYRMLDALGPGHAEQNEAGSNEAGRNETGRDEAGRGTTAHGDNTERADSSPPHTAASDPETTAS